jgi:hypothetical protein
LDITRLACCEHLEWPPNREPSSNHDREMARLLRKQRCPGRQHADSERPRDFPAPKGTAAFASYTNSAVSTVSDDVGCARPALACSSPCIIRPTSCESCAKAAQSWQAPRVWVLSLGKVAVTAGPLPLHRHILWHLRRSCWF